MKANEIILEYKKYPTQEYEGVTFTMVEKDNGVLLVKALNDFGLPMGHVAFNMDGKILDPQDLHVSEKYRGQGIARVMYDYIKSLGFTIERSYDQTPDGKHFWDKNRGEDVRIWEAFDNPYQGKWEHGDDGHDMLVRLPDGTNLSIMFSLDYGWSGDELWTVEFWRNNSLDVTGEGDAQRIFATVLSAIQQFIDFQKPQHIQFSATKETDAGDRNTSRSSLYTSLVKRYARSWGYDVDVSDRASSVGYDLHRMYESVAEQEVDKDSEIPQEIYNLLDELTADDTGSEDFGDYVLRFEGFTDWCQQDAAERCDLPDNDPRKLKYYDDVYAEVINGWIKEQGSQPVDKGFAGSEDYPVQWAIFKKQEVDEGWKDWVAGAAIGAAALGASPDAEAGKLKQHHKPAVVQQVKMQKITPEQSRGGASPAELKQYVEVMAQKYLPANQVAQFVGQVAHETANFTSMIEQHPEKNLKHYAKAKNPLGNKGMEDAQKYIGRGFLQITGKYNYKHFGDMIRPGLGDELLKNPNLAMRKDVAIALAVMFWRERVAPKMAAGASNKEIATAINGRKPKGLEQRAQAVKVASAGMRRGGGPG